MPEDRLSTTELANAIPEVQANFFLGKLASYLNLINTVTVDYGEEAAKFGQTIKIIKRGALVANPKVQKEDVTLQTPSDDAETVTLNKHYEVSISAEDFALAMVKPGVFEGYLDDAAIVLAEEVEDTLAALYASAGLTVNIDETSGDTILASLREARRKLVTNKASKLAAKFAYLSELVIEKLPLTDAAKLGGNLPVVEGMIDRIAGLNLFEAQGVKTSGSPAVYHNLIYTKDAMGLALRSLPSVGSKYGVEQTVVRDPQTGLAIRLTKSYNANGLAPQITLDILWGVAVLRAEHLVDAQYTPA